ncbi:hypothetical protein ACFHPP_26425 [Falsiroseomonas sp. E2-1-a20]
MVAGSLPCPSAQEVSMSVHASIAAPTGRVAQTHTAEPGLPRRVLLGGAGLALGSAISPGAPSIKPAAAQPAGKAPAGRPLVAAVHDRALEIRQACARVAAALPATPHPTNGDEERYASAIGSDTRSLPHDARGEVDPAAWRAFLGACEIGDPADFEKVPLGGTRRLGNPIGTLAVGLCGPDPTQVASPAPPALASAERAAEAVEVYWQALLRDVPLTAFQEGSTHSGVLAACEELNRLGDFRGPKAGGRVTPATLFRPTAVYFDDNDPKGRVVTPVGVLDGPMISQFLLRDVPCGAQWMSARMRPATPESEFLTSWEDWLRAQNGEPPRRGVTYEATPRYIATGRDLAEWVRHVPPFNTMALLLLTTGAFAPDPRYGGLFPAAQPAANPSNPYRRLTRMNPGATFSPFHVTAVMADACSATQRAVYWQKYFVHRTLRPEAYGGLAHQRIVNGVTDYPLHDAFLRSEALERTRAKQGTVLLSQIYPDGAPNFSAYPGGASSVGSAMITVLKAFFDESRVIENAVQVDPQDPTRLIPYAGPPLTLGGELNKLATNFGYARNWGGIHWRSDAAASMAIGEEVAIAMLREIRLTLREPFDGFPFTRFDGSRVTI